MRGFVLTLTTSIGMIVPLLDLNQMILVIASVDQWTSAPHFRRELDDYSYRYKEK
jgi:hypothetical protein